MRIFKDFKYKLGSIGAVGVFIVFVITAIAIYAMKQNIVLQARGDSARIVADFEKYLKETAKDVKFLRTIEENNSVAQTIDDFKKIAKTIYENEPMINGIGLIRQYDIKDEQHIKNALSEAYRKQVDIKPVTKMMSHLKNTASAEHKAVLVYRYPEATEKNVIGIELSSNKARYDALRYVDTFHTFAITKPLDLLNSQGYNALMYLPLSKSNGDYYRWITVVPFQYKNIFEYFLSIHDKQKYRIELYDTGFSQDKPIYQNRLKGKIADNVVLQQYLEIGGRKLLFTIKMEKIYTFTNFWQPILGFLSGIGFVLFLLYYLYFKEMKEMEVGELQLKLLKAEELASIGHFTWSVTQDKLLCSNQVMKLFALETNVVAFKDIKTKIYKKDLTFIDAIMQKAYKGEADMENNVEFRIVGKSGEIKWILSNFTLYYDKKGELERIFGTLQDITDRKLRELELSKKSEMLHFMAMTDQLTKIYNKAYFEDRLSKAISAYKRYDKVFSLIMFDIDDFKHINDVYGHLQGDHVLFEMAALVKRMIRNSDIFCRWGGEEFVIIADGLHASQGMALAEKLRKEIENHTFIKDRIITSSFGVTEVLEQDTQKSIIKRSDEALYKAKGSGKNKAVSL